MSSWLSPSSYISYLTGSKSTKSPPVVSDSDSASSGPTSSNDSPLSVLSSASTDIKGSPDVASLQAQIATLQQQLQQQSPLTADPALAALIQHQVALCLSTHHRQQQPTTSEIANNDASPPTHLPAERLSPSTHLPAERLFVAQPELPVSTVPSSLVDQSPPPESPSPLKSPPSDDKLDSESFVGFDAILNATVAVDEEIPDLADDDPLMVPDGLSCSNTSPKEQPPPESPYTLIPENRQLIRPPPENFVLAPNEFAVIIGNKVKTAKRTVGKKKVQHPYGRGCYSGHDHSNMRGEYPFYVVTSGFYKDIYESEGEAWAATAGYNKAYPHAPKASYRGVNSWKEGVKLLMFNPDNNEGKRQMAQHAAKYPLPGINFLHTLGPTPAWTESQQTEFESATTADKERIRLLEEQVAASRLSELQKDLATASREKAIVDANAVELAKLRNDIASLTAQLGERVAPPAQVSSTNGTRGHPHLTPAQITEYAKLRSGESNFPNWPKGGLLGADGTTFQNTIHAVLSFPYWLNSAGEHPFDVQSTPPQDDTSATAAYDRSVSMDLSVKLLNMINHKGNKSPCEIANSIFDDIRAGVTGRQPSGYELLHALLATKTNDGPVGILKDFATFLSIAQKDREPVVTFSRRLMAAKDALAVHKIPVSDEVVKTMLVNCVLNGPYRQLLSQLRHEYAQGRIDMSLPFSALKKEISKSFDAVCRDKNNIVVAPPRKPGPRVTTPSNDSSAAGEHARRTATEPETTSSTVSGPTTDGPLTPEQVKAKHGKYQCFFCQLKRGDPNAHNSNACPVIKECGFDIKYRRADDTTKPLERGRRVGGPRTGSQGDDDSRRYHPF